MAVAWFGAVDAVVVVADIETVSKTIIPIFKTFYHVQIRRSLLLTPAAALLPPWSRLLVSGLPWGLVVSMFFASTVPAGKIVVDTGPAVAVVAAVVVVVVVVVADYLLSTLPFMVQLIHDCL